MLKNGNTDDRRTEPRFMANGKGHLTVIGAPTYGSYVATVFDVSRTGLQLEMETLLPTGVELRFEFGGLIVIGEVLNHRSKGGRYRIGVQISKVVRSRSLGLSALDNEIGAPAFHCKDLVAEPCGG
jgi:hypothetical protein